MRALARKLDVDLSLVQPRGPDGTITRADVERAAKSLTDAGPAARLVGRRRAMAQRMAAAHVEVVPASETDEADIGSRAGRRGCDDPASVIRVRPSSANLRPPSGTSWRLNLKRARQRSPAPSSGIASVHICSRSIL